LRDADKVYRQNERQREREAERQKDRKTERQKDRKTSRQRQKSRETRIKMIHIHNIYRETDIKTERQMTDLLTERQRQT
jgi:hypothetical protein